MTAVPLTCKVSAQYFADCSASWAPYACEGEGRGRGLEGKEKDKEKGTGEEVRIPAAHHPLCLVGENPTFSVEALQGRKGLQPKDYGHG